MLPGVNVGHSTHTHTQTKSGVLENRRGGSLLWLIFRRTFTAEHNAAVM